MNDNESQKRRNPLIIVIIIQGIFVVTILSVIFFCKYFSESDYLKIKEFYLENMCTDTDVDEVLKEVNGDEI